MAKATIKRNGEAALTFQKNDMVVFSDGWACDGFAAVNVEHINVSFKNGDAAKKALLGENFRWNGSFDNCVPEISKILPKFEDIGNHTRVSFTKIIVESGEDNIRILTKENEIILINENYTPLLLAGDQFHQVDSNGPVAIYKSLVLVAIVMPINNEHDDSFVVFEDLKKIASMV